jgi:hypothetical protein
MNDLAVYQKAVDDFYFQEVVPRFHPSLQTLAVDLAILRHRDSPCPTNTLEDVFGKEYWLVPWMLEEVFPLSEAERIQVAQAFALVFLGFIVLDNTVDGQMPDAALIPVLGQQLFLQAKVAFSHFLAPDDPFWLAYDDNLNRFYNALALEHHCLVAHREPYTYDVMKQVDDGKAAYNRIACHALASLSGRFDHLALANQTYDLLTFADQFGDDAYDWPDDYGEKRATWPFAQLVEREAISLEALFGLGQSEVENRLIKHGILLEMCDHAVTLLKMARQALVAQGFDLSKIVQLLDQRIEEEKLRKRNFMAIFFLEAVARQMGSSR